MIYKIALTECMPVAINEQQDGSGLIKLASGKIFIEPNSDKAKIVQAEISKHPNALFFRAKAIEANKPNTNGDYFSEEELLKSYKTFEGVPFFTNHDNQNIENARGKIIFAEWIPEEKAVYTIAFVDRDAYPHICRSIEEEYVTGVSMGTSVEYSICNICGNKAEKTEDYCTHIRNRKGRKFTGTARNVVTGEIKSFKDQPVFEYNFGLKFIELSAVVDPACPSCHIQGIIPKEDYLKKIANLENSFRMVKTSALEKNASKEEIEQIEGVLGTLEEFAVNLIKKRKQVEPTFAGELVEIMTKLQEWLDELVGAGYGNLENDIPGTVGDDSTQQEPQPQESSPQEAPAIPPLPPSRDTGVVGAVPAATESPVQQPQQNTTVGKITGSPNNPRVSLPKLPITTPLKPKADDSRSIKRIADQVIERLANGKKVLFKMANFNDNFNKTGEEIMGKRRTIAEKTEQKSLAKEILSNSWKEKQDFLEYIKEVPSLQDNQSRLSVKKRDDSFIIVAERKNDSDNAMTWTFEDLTKEQKQMIKDTPKKAAAVLLDTFSRMSKDLTTQKEGAKIMIDNISKKAGADSVNKNPEVVTERQLDDKNLYHSRTVQEIEQVTEAQLAAKRKNDDPEVITERQLDGGSKLNSRHNETVDQVGEAQLESVREKSEPEVVTERQLDSHRADSEEEVITEKQLSEVAAPWSRAANRNPSMFKSAADHLNVAIEVMANSVISAGCTPDEACSVAASLVDTTKNRYDLATSITETNKSVEEIDFAKRAAYWNNHNLKVASTGKKEIASLIVEGLRKVASDKTINPDVLINAVDVIGEGADAITAISNCVEQKIKTSENIAKASAGSIKTELREALKGKSETKADRDQERKEILAEVATEESKLQRESERATWEKIINKAAVASTKADTVIETDFNEVGYKNDGSSYKTDPSFKKAIVAFTKGAMAANNLKTAAITNVTISGDTIQIAVQTDEGSQAVEIPVGENAAPAQEEQVPEGDLTGEGLENTIPQQKDVAAAPSAGAKASSGKVVKTAQTPSGGGIPGTPGGASAPGMSEQSLPGGAPHGDAVQTLTKTEDAGVESIPTIGEQQMPWTICPECGSSDVDVTNEHGDIKGKCNNAECGAEYEAMVKKEIEFKIVKPSKAMSGEGSAEKPSAPEVPALPVAAQTRIDKNSLVRIGKNKEKHGHVCPACGQTSCKTNKDEQGHAEFVCPSCQTEVTKDILVSASNPEVGMLRVSWNIQPSTGCKDCGEKVAKFASKIKVEKLLKSAAADQDKFPMANCIERIARKFGGNSVGSFGPCKGKLLADCICKQLQKTALTKVRHLTKLAEVSLTKDPMDECLEDQQKKGHDIKEATSICNCLKKQFADVTSDNIFVQAFAEDIANGKEKDLTTQDLIELDAILKEEVASTEKNIVTAAEDIDEDIGSDLPALKEATVEVELVKEAKKEEKICEKCKEKVCVCEDKKEEKEAATSTETVVKEAKGFMCDKCNKPKTHCKCENDDGDKDKKDEDKGETKEASIMDSKRILKTNEEVFQMATTKTAGAPKFVEHVEEKVEAGVPRADGYMGKEKEADSLINKPLAKPNVPRSQAYMGKEKEADSLINKDSKLPDVAQDSSFIGHEKEVQKDMPSIVNEIKGTVIASDVKVTKEAKQLKEVETVEGDVEAKVPRSDAKMGEESKADSLINAPNKGPDIPSGDGYMGKEKEADSLINSPLKGPDVPVDNAFMGHEKEVQKDMPKINDEILKVVRQQREDQLSKIASAREKKANQVVSWLVANKRIDGDLETFENAVKALAGFEIDKIVTVAEKLFPAKSVKTSSVENSQTKTAGTHSIPAIVLESKQNDEPTLASKLSSNFTIGNSQFDKDLTIYGEK
jgi:hypothetical protein